jgi:hypothetical protein
MAFIFEKNIVIFSEGRLFGHIDKNWFDGRVAVNRNVYWKTGGAPFDFAGKSWDEWRFLGNDAEGLVADPLFTAPEKGDYTLRADSPAPKLGFKPFDWREAGVTGDAAWKKLAAVELPPMTFGMKPKAPPLTLHEGFENTPVGGKPSQAQGRYKKGPIIAVVGPGASKGARCLQLTDGPDIEPAFEPHFYYLPNHDRGTAHVAFDVKLEPAFHFQHEWRENTVTGARAYQSGPMIEFRKGVLSSGGRRLTEYPSNEWLHVDLSARIGEGRDNTFDLTVTVPGRQPQHFAKLPFATTNMKKLDWVGFISPGKEAAKCWLDEIVIESRDPE